MPRIKKHKIAIGYLRIRETSTPADMPRDIGNPAEAHVDTLKWLNGERPSPEQSFMLVVDDDGEALDRFREGIFLDPDRATGLGAPAVQFLLQAEAARKDLLKSEQNRRQRATREQAQDAALRGVLVRREDSEKWRDFARKVLDRGGDETPLQMATRIQEELLEAGWVRKAEWKTLSKTERRDTDTGYVTSVDVIVRFLRNPTKTQRQ